MKYSIILFSVLLIFSCQNEKLGSEEENLQVSEEVTFSKSKINLADIEIGKIQLSDMSEKIYCKGRIMAKPKNRVKYSAPTEGFIKNIYIQNGQNVIKGKHLIRIKHPEIIILQKDYLIIKSKFELAEKEYERQKTLTDSNAGTKKLFEKSKSEYEQLKSQLAALKLELAYLNINAEKLSSESILSSIPIYSPISGNINEINISIGQYVKPDDVLFEIINNKEFILELNIFERDIHKIHIGQLVTYDCSIPESKNSLHTAEIISIGNYIDQSTKTFKVLAKPKDYDIGMRHGIFINAQINLSDEKIQVLPDEAIIEIDGEKYIFLVQADSIFKKHKIDIGIKEDGFTQINDKDLLNKDIVIKGANYIIAELDLE